MSGFEFEIGDVEALPKRESRKGLTKYPFADLARRGQTMTTKGPKSVSSVKSAARLYSKNHKGVKFLVRPLADGRVKVWRVS